MSNSIINHFSRERVQAQYGLSVSKDTITLPKGTDPFKIGFTELVIDLEEARQPADERRARISAYAAAESLTLTSVSEKVFADRFGREYTITGETASEIEREEGAERRFQHKATNSMVTEHSFVDKDGCTVVLPRGVTVEQLLQQEQENPSVLDTSKSSLIPSRVATVDQPIGCLSGIWNAVKGAFKAIGDCFKAVLNCICCRGTRALEVEKPDEQKKYVGPRTNAVPEETPVANTAYKIQADL